ncbi:UNVERIFIED_CONTAM: hypothetical protein FKN15_066993 [Acipenser sinensis]
MFGGPPPPAVIKLPYGLKPKKVYKPEAAMKRANWSKIVPQEMTENCFWIKVKEEKFESPDLFTKMALLFATKTTGSFRDEISGRFLFPAYAISFALLL